MMLFDVTTLYFESVQPDELRAFGYSKDQKYHCTQVVLALPPTRTACPSATSCSPATPRRSRR
jgi:hypothetical protein